MPLWEWIKVALLGVLEGLTEFLPVSSTGHLILLEDLLPLPGSPAFRDAFFTVIQLGAVAAVALLYGRRLWPLQKSGPGRAPVKRRTLSLWGKTAAACVPGALAVFLLGDALHAVERPWVVAVALMGYGAIFLVLDGKARPARVREAEDLSYGDALWVGAFQILSLVPGTSRSGSTIIGALTRGVSRPAAAEFSFFLALPVMAGYSLWKLLRCGALFTGTEWAMLALGTLTAFLTALPVVKAFTGFLKKRGFAPFGWYRIALGLIVLLRFWMK